MVCFSTQNEFHTIIYVENKNCVFVSSFVLARSNVLHHEIYSKELAHFKYKKVIATKGFEIIRIR